jgi:hypothetical protein
MLRGDLHLPEAPWKATNQLSGHPSAQPGSMDVQEWPPLQAFRFKSTAFENFPNLFGLRMVLWEFAHWLLLGTE